MCFFDKSHLKLTKKSTNECMLPYSKSLCGGRITAWYQLNLMGRQSGLPRLQINL